MGAWRNLLASKTVAVSSEYIKINLTVIADFYCISESFISLFLINSSMIAHRFGQYFHEKNEYSLPLYQLSHFDP